MRIIVFSLFLGAASIATAADGGISASGLRCDFRKNPLGIEDLHPRLSWTVSSEQRGAVQSAYRIVAATSNKLLETEEADLWDSGKVESSEMHTH
ncbi:MAG: hypothetical protein U9Q79_11245, partial [Candidatus Hydrogenedentes bacterium]|nr:hypothetical protein [Candidatus Hydrogenedentota bacterium]